ncbi:MAG: nucleotidyl transferase AbiEii/AbiGii toxin family protein [Pseudonocardiales bacterium]
MRYRDAAAFRQALERRLKERTAGVGAHLARDRKRVAFDRLLARLLAVAADRWLLKGGFALDLRLTERARATKDIDLDWGRDREDELLDTLLDAADHDAGDFFTFRIERAGPPQDQLGGSRRFSVSASLAGREFETFLLDIGFRVISTQGVEALTTPDLLAFAGLPPVTVPALPLETQVAEKLHAYTRSYADAQPSSRTKDLVDLVLISELANLDATSLQRAIQETFTVRGTHPVPEALPPPPQDWSAPFGELARTVGIPTDLAVGFAAAAQLLDPILNGRLPNGTWDFDKRQWAQE